MADEFDIKGDGKWILDGDGKWKIDACCCPCLSATCCGCCCDSGHDLSLSISALTLCRECGNWLEDPAGIEENGYKGTGVEYTFYTGTIPLEMGTSGCPNVAWSGQGNLYDTGLPAEHDDGPIPARRRWVAGSLIWDDDTNCWTLRISCLYNYPGASLEARMFGGYKGGGTPCGVYTCSNHPDGCTEGAGPEDCGGVASITVTGCPGSGACGEEGCNCYPAWTAGNCDCSAEYPCAPCDTASSYSITGYSSSFFTVSGCTSCSTSTESEWNGSFLKASVLWPSEEGYFDQGSATGAVRINGKTHLLTELENAGSICKWNITIKCDDQTIWAGSKSNENEPTPVGTYTRSSGCDTRGTIAVA